MCKLFEVEESDVPHRGQPTTHENGKQLSAAAKLDIQERTSMKSPSRRMPETEGIDDHELHAKPKAKLVTPMKDEREVVDESRDFKSYIAEKKDGDSKATSKRRVKSGEKRCSLQMLHLEAAPSSGRERQRESRNKHIPTSQQTNSNTIDLTGSGGVIDLTSD